MKNIYCGIGRISIFKGCKLQFVQKSVGKIKDRKKVSL